jgi:hypothetical protein
MEISPNNSKNNAQAVKVIALKVVVAFLFGYDAASLGKQVPNKKVPLSRKLTLHWRVLVINFWEIL